MVVAPSQSSPRDDIPVAEYVRGNFVPLSHLTHGWELHSALPLTPAEERTMVREPAQAVPASIAERLGKRSEEHTSELQSRLHLVCRLLLEKKKSRGPIPYR